MSDKISTKKSALHPSEMAPARFCQIGHGISLHSRLVISIIAKPMQYCKGFMKCNGNEVRLRGFEMYSFSNGCGLSSRAMRAMTKVAAPFFQFIQGLVALFFFLYRVVSRRHGIYRSCCLPCDSYIGIYHSYRLLSNAYLGINCSYYIKYDADEIKCNTDRLKYGSDKMKYDADRLKYHADTLKNNSDMLLNDSDGILNLVPRLLISACARPFFQSISDSPTCLTTR
jgi:hypothetical protein